MRRFSLVAAMLAATLILAGCGSTSDKAFAFAEQVTAKGFAVGDKAIGGMADALDKYCDSAPVPLRDFVRRAVNEKLAAKKSSWRAGNLCVKP